MKERLKEVRKSTVLPGGKKSTQENFAEFLGISKSAVIAYETGNREPTSAAIQLICEKCNVNFEWLKTGNGEMHSPMSREDEMAQLAADLLHCDDKFIKEVTRELLAMTPEQISAMKGIILHLADVNFVKRLDNVKV